MTGNIVKNMSNATVSPHIVRGRREVKGEILLAPVTVSATDGMKYVEAIK